MSSTDINIITELSDGRIILSDGSIICPASVMKKHVADGGDLDNLFVDESEISLFSLYNSVSSDDEQVCVKDSIHDLDVSIKIPRKYLELDLNEYVVNLLSQREYTQKEVDRVETELRLFQECELEDILRLSIYIVDVLNYNDVVFGLGRGSMIASYVLHLVGLHEINPLDFDICYSEFFKRM